jgi:hypothetical protein
MSNLEFQNTDDAPCRLRACGTDEPEVLMGILTLAVELAFAKAWQSCRAADSTAGNRDQLKVRLRKYLIKNPAGSSEALTADGLHFLKRSNRSSARQSGKVRSETL